SGTIVEVNQAACQLLGYDREELLSMGVRDTLTPEYAAGVAATCRQLLADKHAIFEREHQTKAGHRISVEVNAHLFDLGGRPIVMSVARDITERKRLQDQLLYRMELERLVASASAQLVSLHSEQADSAIEAALGEVGRFGAADRAYVFLLSADQTSMTNTHEWCAAGIAPQKDSLSDLPTSSLPWWTEHILALQTIDIPSVAGLPAEAGAEQAILQAQDIRSLVVVPLAHGERSIGFLGFDSVRGTKQWATEDVRLLQTLGDMISATIERRRAERALRASEERYRVLFNSLTDAVLVYALGADGEPPTLSTVNDHASRLTGYDQHQLLGLTPGQLYASGGTPLQQEPFARGKRYLFQDAFVTRSGEKVPVEVSVSMFDFETRPMMIAVARNMTEHQRLEQQLLQAQKMEVVGRLAGGVAHDFNNLLTAISGHASFTLEAVAEDSPAADDLNDLLAAVQRARELTGQLLAFSRRQFIELRLLDLTSLVADLRKMLARLIGEDIELVTPAGADRTAIRGDRGQIEQVIVNLVVNARDAMPRGGKLTVSSGRVSLNPEAARRRGVPPGDYATLVVRDTGTGMTEQVKMHLFEPFFTTKDVGRGTGLGLATVYGIVKQHGGHVEVESRPGAGSTFTIYLPLAGGNVTPPTESADRTAPVGGTETVLLVEDDASVRRVTERMLRGLGYHVLAATDGPHALTLATEHEDHIDVLITDVVMPRMGGAELARAVRLRRPGISVLFVSGYTAGVVSEHGIRDGSVDLLQKPYTQEALATRLRAAIARRQEARPA
ncbi:MAG: PAS domain S-box protein, partial [Anaerolineae bacterium]